MELMRVYKVSSRIPLCIDIQRCKFLQSTVLIPRALMEFLLTSSCIMLVTLTSIHIQQEVLLSYLIADRSRVLRAVSRVKFWQNSLTRFSELPVSTIQDGLYREAMYLNMAGKKKTLELDQNFHLTGRFFYSWCRRNLSLCIGDFDKILWTGDALR